MRTATYYLFIIYNIAQLGAAYIGMNFYLGMVSAWIVIISLFMFRLNLAISVAAFLAAINVWHWHWAFAALFIAPAVLQMISKIIMPVINEMKLNRLSQNSL